MLRGGRSMSVSPKPCHPRGRPAGPVCFEAGGLEVSKTADSENDRALTSVGGVSGDYGAVTMWASGLHVRVACFNINFRPGSLPPWRAEAFTFWSAETSVLPAATSSLHVCSFLELSASKTEPPHFRPDVRARYHPGSDRRDNAAYGTLLTASQACRTTPRKQ
jgi:hypothetical protein